LILANLGRDAEAKEAVVRTLCLNLIFVFPNGPAASVNGGRDCLSTVAKQD
jgi:hypothetical protein